MNMLKSLTRRSVCIALTLLLALGTLPAAFAAGAADSGYCGEHATWNLKDDGELVISGSDSMCDWGYGEAPWYEERASIKSVTFYGFVANVGEYAFSGCDALESVSLSSSVKSIGYSAFYDCTALETVDLGETEQIAGSAFYGCTALSELTLPDTVESVGDLAFYGCTSLSDVAVGSGIRAVGNEAFFNTAVYKNADSWVNDVLYIDNCLIIAKKSISGEYSVNALATLIADNAFSGCTGLTGLILPEGLKAVGTRAFYGCTGLSSVDVPESVTDIGARALGYYNGGGADALYSPFAMSGTARSEAEEYAGDNGIAFTVRGGAAKESGECGESLNWELDDHGVLTVSGSGFMDDFIPDKSPWYEWRNLIETAIIYDGARSVGDFAFKDCENLESITLPDSVEALGYCSIDNTAYLDNPDNWIHGVLYLGNHLVHAELGGQTSYTVRESTVSISPEAFMSCAGLESVTLPDSLRVIGESAFNGCYDLKSIDLPDSLEIIGSYAFVSCGLSSVDLPAGVTHIGEKAFGYFENDNLEYPPLDDFTIYGYMLSEAHKYAESNGFDFVPHKLFEGECGDSLTWELDKDTGVLTVSGVGDMYNYKQYGAPWYASRDFIKALTVGDRVTGIGEYAFYGCETLSGVILPDSAVRVGRCAFENSELYGDPGNWADGVLYIGKQLIKADTEVVECEIRSGVVCVADGAFEGCAALKSVTIPASVTNIGDRAFYSCGSLKVITIPDSVSAVGEKAFGYYTDSENAEQKVNGFLIRGYAGSAAEVYARGNSLAFDTIIRHRLVHHFTGSTCTVPGEEYDLCLDCAEIFNHKNLPLEPHNYDVWIILRESSVAFTGIRERKCKDCGYVEQGMLAKYDSLEAADAVSGITVFYARGVLNSGVTVSASRITGGEAFDALTLAYGEFTLYDISVLLNGAEVQPSGKVWVKAPIPAGYRHNDTAVYYLNSSGGVTPAKSYCIDGFIYFEASHFSYYCVRDTSVPHASESCTCLCHKTGFLAFIYKIALFFWKLFKTNQTCKCGWAHY